MIEVLFVCTGNICRSPTAEGVFRRLVRDAGLAGRVRADSAGTEAFHVGEAPDPRSRAAARIRGYPIDDLSARQVSAGDFYRFNLILAMDRGHYQQLSRLAPLVEPGQPALMVRFARLHLLMDFAPELGVRDVPDPYFGGADGFNRVLDLIEAGARGLLAAIVRDGDRL